MSNQHIRQVNADNSKYFKIVLGVQTDAMAAKGQHQINAGNVGKKNQTIWNLNWRLFRNHFQTDYNKQQ